MHLKDEVWNIKVSERSTSIFQLDCQSNHHFLFSWGKTDRTFSAEKAVQKFRNPPHNDVGVQDKNKITDLSPKMSNAPTDSELDGFQNLAAVVKSFIFAFIIITFPFLLRLYSMAYQELPRENMALFIMRYLLFVLRINL